MRGKGLLIWDTGTSTLNSRVIQDPFGNYVVQYVLGLQDPQAAIRIGVGLGFWV